MSKISYRLVPSVRANQTIFIRPSILQFVSPSIHPPTIHPSFHLSVRLSAHPSFRPSKYIQICLNPSKSAQISSNPSKPVPAKLV
uniref:Uncharacterized protein n=1 Tax=Acrobeloides nanus TaxID=290746 RepID=A0A914ER06_9BILA